MGKHYCEEVLVDVVEEASRQFGRFWVINDKYYDILKNYAENFDKLVDEFDITAFEVSVDDIKMTVTISFITDSFEVCDHMHIYTRLLMRAINVEYEHGEGDTVIAKHTFPSIWERA